MIAGRGQEVDGRFSSFFFVPRGSFIGSYRMTTGPQLIFIGLLGFSGTTLVIDEKLRIGKGTFPSTAKNWRSWNDFARPTTLIGARRFSAGDAADSTVKGSAATPDVGPPMGGVILLEGRSWSRTPPAKSGHFFDSFIPHGSSSNLT